MNLHVLYDPCHFFEALGTATKKTHRVTSALLPFLLIREVLPSLRFCAHGLVGASASVRNPEQK